MFEDCAVEPIPGGRDGISLRRPDRGMPGPSIGWGERRQEVLDGDALFAPLPETRALAVSRGELRSLLSR